MRSSDCPQDRAIRILLVMAQPLAKEYAVELLRSEGYNVLATSDGEAAIVLFQEVIGRIDLVITDSQVDSINGFQLANELLKRRPATKILLTSSVPVVENAAVHRGFGFLRKPYLAVTFKRRVRAILASAYPTALSTAYPNAG
jgi:DNA-binding response OmpR family regulator